MKLIMIGAFSSLLLISCLEKNPSEPDSIKAPLDVSMIYPNGTVIIYPCEGLPAPPCYPGSPCISNFLIEGNVSENQPFSGIDTVLINGEVPDTLLAMDSTSSIDTVTQYLFKHVISYKPDSSFTLRIYLKVTDFSGNQLIDSSNVIYYNTCEYN